MADVRETSCIDCGQQIVKHGGGLLPSRCKPCAHEHDKAGKRERSIRVSAERRAELREMRCVDCDEYLGVFTLGRPKERCAPCKKERDKETQRLGYHRNGDARRAANLASHYKKKYGITVADREAMFNLQGGVCAICGGKANGRNSSLHVDHCHTTNQVRGLLCFSCNQLIGLAKDDPVRLDSAAAYLRKHSTQ